MSKKQNNNYKPKDDNKNKKGARILPAKEGIKQHLQNPKENSYNVDCKKYGSDTINDWSWYAPDQTMLKQAGSISFFTPQGTDMEVKSIGSGTIANVTSTYSVPGLLDVKYYNTIGRCDSNAAAANVAANLIYTYVRHMNSGSKNYESSDLMLYLLAMDDVYTHIAQVGKLLGLVRNWHSKNKYMPRAIFKAVQIDYDDAASRLSEYYFRLNVLTAKCKYFNVPKIFPLYKRHLWLVSNLFADGPDGKSCIINMHNYVMHYYSAKTSETGGELKPEVIYPTITDVTSTLGKVMDNIDRAIGLLLADEDIGIMSGDILKAYGNDLFVPGFYDANEVIEPFYSNELLDSLQNMVIPFDPTTVPLTEIGGAKIQQVGNVLKDGITQWISDQLIETNNIGALTTSILNSFMAEPDAIQNMLATRFTVLVNNFNSQDGKVEASYGTEFVMGLRFIYMVGGDLEIGTTFGTMINNFKTTSDTAVATSALSACATLDRHPTLYIKTKVGVEPNEVYSFKVEGDFENTTVLTYETLNKLHTCATLGEFNIPG